MMMMKIMRAKKVSNTRFAPSSSKKMRAKKLSNTRFPKKGPRR